MDIVVFSPDKKNRSCIEIKFPLNGQYPEQMYAMCRDIRFLEQLTEAGFNKSYLLAVADDPLFYEKRGNQEGKIYDCFRGDKAISGKIVKPTGRKDDCVEIKGRYSIKWQEMNNNMKYFLLETDR